MGEHSESLWDAKAVARYLAVSVRKVYDLAQHGLPHFRVGRLYRFEPANVKAYLERKEQNADG